MSVVSSAGDRHSGSAVRARLAHESNDADVNRLLVVTLTP
jgi:hypothetical protein